MPDQPYNPNQQAGEISLKEVILIVKDYLAYLLSSFWWILAGMILVAGLFLLRTFFDETTYTADLTFMINDESGGSSGGGGGILGQLGIGGSSSGGGLNINKLEALSKTRTIIEKVFFKQAIIDDQEDYIVNHIIRAHRYHEEWEDSPNLRGVLFTHDSISAFDRTESSALKVLHAKVVKSGEDDGHLMDISSNPETGILTLLTTTYNEALSLILAEVMYEELSQYYTLKEVGQRQRAYKRAVLKRDSIYGELLKVESGLAITQDRGRNLIRRSDRLREAELLRQQQILNAMYAEATRQSEASAYILNNETPVFQLIDYPIVPLTVDKGSSKVKAIIFGAFAGLVLSVLFLISRKTIRDALAEG